MLKRIVWDTVLERWCDMQLEHAFAREHRETELAAFVIGLEEMGADPVEISDELGLLKPETLRLLSHPKENLDAFMEGRDGATCGCGDEI